MRITHLTDCYLPLLGGIETQVARLAQQQAAAGHDVAVVCTTPARPGAHGVSTERDGDVTVHRLAARVPGGYPVHPRAPHHVARVLRADRPDVVHLHMGVLTPSTQASLRTVVRAGLPAVLTVHSVWGGAERAFAGLDRVVRWSRWPVLWSAVSELTAAPLRRIVGDRGEVVVLHNGLDLDAWRVPAPSAPAAWRAQPSTSWPRRGTPRASACCRSWRSCATPSRASPRGRST